MKGATAEPFASTSTTPSSAITTKTGISQYFFRARIKAMNSRMKVMLELILHALRLVLRALDPVRGRIALQLASQRVGAEKAHGDAEGKEHRVVEHRQGERADDRSEQRAEPHPRVVERRKDPWQDQGDDKKGARGDERPDARSAPVQHEIGRASCRERV